MSRDVREGRGGPGQPRDWIGRIPFLLWCISFWVALWEKASLGVVVSGAFLAVAIWTRFRGAGPRAVRGLRPLKALEFALYFGLRLIQANLVVAWEVVTPKSSINQGVVEVPLRSSSDALVSLVANAVSLTPGTLTIDVRRDPTVLYVHVLHLRDPDEVRRDIQKLEELASRAFGREEISNTSKSDRHEFREEPKTSLEA